MTQISMQPEIGYREFVALMALMISLVALSIDTMLPALSQIGADFAVADPNDNQLVITTVFLGMAVGQLFYGPLSDSIGRKPCIYIGIAVFTVGCLMSIFADSFNMMIAGRLLQGLGVAGPRIVSVALIRDKYEGRRMAQVMSLVMTLFILMPVVAPAIGQGIMLVAHWRAIFAFILCLAVVALVWFAIRQPETLPVEKRNVFSASRIFAAVRFVCTSRIAFGYTVVSGFVSGIFLAFLSSSQQLLQIQYGLGEQFPLYFAIVALSIGVASFVNARLVLRLGMVLLCQWALVLLLAASLLFLLFALYAQGHPALGSFVGFLLFTFFCIGILFGNLNALAMQPLGDIAGVGAAVTGSLSVFLSLPLGMYIGGSYDGTVLPLVTGFAVCGLLSIVVLYWAGRSADASAEK